MVEINDCKMINKLTMDYNYLILYTDISSFSMEDALSTVGWVIYFFGGSEGGGNIDQNELFRLCPRSFALKLMEITSFKM